MLTGDCHPVEQEKNCSMTSWRRQRRWLVEHISVCVIVCVGSGWGNRRRRVCWVDPSGITASLNEDNEWERTGGVPPAPRLTLTLRSIAAASLQLEPEANRKNWLLICKDELCWPHFQIGAPCSSSPAPFCPLCSSGVGLYNQSWGLILSNQQLIKKAHLNNIVTLQKFHSAFTLTWKGLFLSFVHFICAGEKQLPPMVTTDTSCVF